MEYVSLSQKDINKAITSIVNAQCCMTEEWFSWVETIVVNEKENLKKFKDYKEKCRVGNMFTVKEISLPTELKKNYPINSSIKLFSKEFILIGNDNNIKEAHLTLKLSIEQIVSVLNLSYNTGNRKVYVIACKNKGIIKRLTQTELEIVTLMCEVLQLSDDYHVYDCSSYDVSSLTNDNILSKIHKFRKLL